MKRKCLSVGIVTTLLQLFLALPALAEPETSILGAQEYGISLVLDKGRSKTYQASPPTSITSCVPDDTSVARCEFDSLSATIIAVAPGRTAINVKGTRRGIPKAATVTVVVPGCQVTLYLDSIEVFNDTEIGQEEWFIQTTAHLRIGLGTAITYTVADYGDGVVPVGAIIGDVDVSKKNPLNAYINADVTEIDPLESENGNGASSTYFICPSAYPITQKVTVSGSGLDPFGLEDFAVELTYNWRMKWF